MRVGHQLGKHLSMNFLTLQEIAHYIHDESKAAFGAPFAKLAKIIILVDLEAEKVYCCYEFISPSILAQ